MTDETHESPMLDEHPGLDNDEATDEGKKMTAAGTAGSTPATVRSDTLDAHPGLDNDEATDEGKLMTAEGSVGMKRRKADRT